MLLSNIWNKEKYVVEDTEFFSKYIRLRNFFNHNLEIFYSRNSIPELKI